MNEEMEYVDNDDFIETVDEPEVEVESEPEVSPEPEVEPTLEPEAEPQQPESRDNDFARMRRSMEQQFQNSTEYKLAKKLADRYGVSVEEMMQQLDEQDLEAQAKKENVPKEYLKRQQNLEAEVNSLKEE